MLNAVLLMLWTLAAIASQQPDSQDPHAPGVLGPPIPFETGWVRSDDGSGCSRSGPAFQAWADHLCPAGLVMPPENPSEVSISSTFLIEIVRDGDALPSAPHRQDDSITWQEVVLGVAADGSVTHCEGASTGPEARSSLCDSLRDDPPRPFTAATDGEPSRRGRMRLGISMRIAPSDGRTGATGDSR